MTSASSSVVPPTAFAMVCPGVYRSGFPTRHNLSFLDRLHLRTLVQLEPKAHGPDVAAWVERIGMRVVECNVEASREPFVVADPAEIHKALQAMLDPQHQPVLIHSSGSRVSLVIGCLRKMQRWSFAAITEEYRRFAGASSSLLDLQCIELYDPEPAQSSLRAANMMEDEEIDPGATVFLSLAVPTSPKRTAPSKPTTE